MTKQNFREKKVFQNIMCLMKVSFIDRNAELPISAAFFQASALVNVLPTITLLASCLHNC